MNKRLIFLHIPKNGGTTFNSILNKNFKKKHTYHFKGHEDAVRFKNMTDLERNAFQLLTGHIMFGKHSLLQGDSNYVTFLRKPVDRMISFYYFAKSNDWHRCYNDIHNKNLNLYDFAKTNTREDINNAQIRLISGINDTPELMLEKALSNIESYFPVVGLLEKYNESLLLLKKYYNWKMPYYAQRNKTVKRKKTNEIDVKTSELISELNYGDELLYREISKRFDKQLAEYKNLEQDLKKLESINRIYSTGYNFARKIKHSIIK